MLKGKHVSNKLLDYSSSLSRTLSLELDAHITEIKRSIKSAPYVRAVELKQLVDGLTQKDLTPPNISNPSEDDIAITVHILAQLEGQITTQRIKYNTGMYSYEPVHQMKLIHALGQEYAILVRQIKTKYPVEQHADTAKPTKEPIKVLGYGEAVAQGMKP